MDWIQYRFSRRSAVAKDELKICALCGALNHERNDECLICGWQGCFLMDASEIHIAWERLRNQFEQVCMQHVSVSPRSSKILLGEDRIAKPFWQRCREVCQHRWGILMRARARRKAITASHAIPPINHAP